MTKQTKRRRPQPEGLMAAAGRYPHGEFSTMSAHRLRTRRADLGTQAQSAPRR